MRAIVLVFYFFKVIFASLPAEATTTCQDLISSTGEAHQISFSEEHRIQFFKNSLGRSGSIENLAVERYGESVGASALARLRQMGHGFEELISDPGIVLRLDDFEKFLSSQPKSNAWDSREKYRMHLGTTRVYRALALTPEMASV